MTAFDDETLIRWSDGELSPDEAARLETAALTDADLGRPYAGPATAENGDAGGVPGGGRSARQRSGSSDRRAPGEAAVSAGGPGPVAGGRLRAAPGGGLGGAGDGGLCRRPAGRPQSARRRRTARGL